MRRGVLMLLAVLLCAIPAAAQRISTVAGTGVRSYTGDAGPAINATLQFPFGVARDGAGNLYIADSGNQVIRRVAASNGNITTVAGDGTICASSTTPCGDGGLATSAQLADPQAVIVDGSGNLFIADGSNHRIRRVDAGTQIITTVAGTGVAGFGGDNGAATGAQLNGPTGLAMDGGGNLFVADFFNQRVRRVAASNGNITTVAGTGTAGFNGDNIAANTAQLNDPFGVAADAAGNFFIAEFSGHRVRRVDAGTQNITTVAGTGAAGFNGDGIAANTAQLSAPTGVDVDGTGNVFIADFGNLRVRRVAAGTISTVAGNGTACAVATTPCGDGGLATAAQITDAAGVEVDPNLNLFIADTGNSKIRVVVGPADLGMTKTDAPDPVNVGNDLTYTVVVTNAGPNAATNVTLTDPLPANTAFQSLASPAGWTCMAPAVGGTGTITCTNPSLAVAAPATFTIVIRPGAGAVGALNNTATVAIADQADPNATNNSATASTTVGGSADLNVTKADAPDPVNAGANITYTVVVTNNGPNSATSVTLTDPLPAGATFQSATVPAGWACTTPAVGAGGTISCTIAALANAASDTFTFVVRAGGTPGALPNTATVASTTTDPVTADDSATATTTVNAVADLAVTKTDSPDPVNLGSNVTYTIVVTNNGPSPATSVVLTDPLPAGVTFVSATAPCAQAAGNVTCNLGTLNSGAASNISIVITPTAAGNLSNTATVASAVTDPNNANNSATAATVVNSTPDFTVSVAPNPFNVASGLTASLTVTVTPNPAPFANAVALACSNLPALATCFFSQGSVTPGANPATSQLQITTQRPGVAPPQFTGRMWPAPWLWTGFAGLLAVTWLALRRTESRALRYAFSVVLLAAALLFQTACAQNESTPPGTYSITVTGTSGATVRSTVLTLNVQ